MRYDEAELIVEVVAGERFGEEQSTWDFDLDTYRAQVVKAEAEGCVPPPPPPPPPVTGKVKAEVKTVFKGSLDFDEIALKSSLDGANCGWLPRPGSRYILYLGKPDKDQGSTVYWVGSCGRKLNASKDNYKDEKRILTKFSVAEDGVISEKQVINMHVGPMEYCPLKGSFKDGERDGEWLIYPPVYFWRDTLDFHQTAFILEYEVGKIVEGGEVLANNKDNQRSRWLYFWKLFYFNPFEDD
ncbi:MAG: hypothetical protein ACJATN_001532 [Neolewinella sp.]|jgi:hypothetical protein